MHAPNIINCVFYYTHKYIFVKNNNKNFGKEKNLMINLFSNEKNVI